MRIAVINETSAADRNTDILLALEGSGNEVINAGMKKNFDQPELTYIHTGFLSALLLNTKRVDYVVGGCGTGQGFLNSVMQYPGVVCGLMESPLDAWLFTQINNGNCISLRLNQGYGWASNENLKFIFEKLFSVSGGCGYPAHRKESQKESLKKLKEVSTITHRGFAEIVEKLPEEIIKPALNYPGIPEILDINSLEDKGLANLLNAVLN
jgi:ribose 5-phosphate isomerase RpiB